MMLRYSLSLLLGTILAAAPGAAQTQSQDAVSYNVTLTDMSPMITYTPAVLPNSATWNSLPPPTCYGSLSCHTTSSKGASVGITFTGTGASFLVSGAATLSLAVDGRLSFNRSVPNPSVVAGPVPVGVSGLSYGAHTVSLSLLDGSLSFYSVVLTAVVGSADAQTKPETLTALASGAPNPALSLDAIASQWYATGNSSDFCSGSAMGGACVHSGSRLTTNTSGATMSFMLPSNTSIVQLIGSVGNLIGGYTVTLTPPPIFGTQALTLNAWNPTFSTMQDNVLYYSAVDPAAQYNLSVTYQGGEQGTTWQLWGVTFVTVSGGTGIQKNDTSIGTPGGGGGNNGGGSHSGATTSRLSTAAIVGIVIGTLVAIGLIAFILWFFLRRERRATNLLQEFKVSNDNRLNMVELEETHDNSQTGQQTDALLSTSPATGAQEVYVTPYRAGDALTSGSQTVGAPTHRTRRSSAQKSDFRLTNYSLSTDNSLGEDAGPAFGRPLEQEVDGGRVVVPPSYDPSWADDGEGVGSVTAPHTTAKPKREKEQLLLN